MDIPRGTCRDMCPYKETVMREKENLLHFFEMEPGTERNKRPRARKNFVVKEYSRPAAGKEDARHEDLRPPVVLQRTVDYLIKSIVPRTDRSWNFVYDYVFDRLRAVRKDMVIQRITGKNATDLLERIVRFHIYAGYRLCTKPIAVFDPKINDTHTQECLKRLLVLYQTDLECRKNMGEILAIYILYNLGQTEALHHGILCKHLLRDDLNFMNAIDASISAMMGNYVRVFRICCKMAPIYQCAVHAHLCRIQSEALSVMSSGYHSKSLRFPFLDLVKILSFKDVNEAKVACRARGLDVNEQGVIFSKTSLTSLEKVTSNHHSFIEDSLRNTDLPVLILNQQISETPIE